MRLALLTHEPFYPPSGGGSAEAVYLVEEMKRRGHDIHLFCPQVASPSEVRDRFGVTLYEFKKWAMGRYASLRNLKYLLYPFFLCQMVRRQARETPFDLIFSQHAISAVAAGWLKQRLHVPTVMNFLDYLTGFMETWPAYLAPPPLLRQLTRFELSLPRRYQADGLLTVSDTLADYFANSGYPRQRIRPIYYGFDAAIFPFREARPEAAGLSEPHPIIVMHGSLDHHHLGPIALGAMKQVVQREPGARFRFVGQRTAALERFLLKVKAEIPDAAVETTGFVPYREVASQLAGATAGIVPYEESKGTHCAFVAKIVEYLAIGLPVVSTPLNSAERYFGKEPRVRFSSFNGSDFGEKILGWLKSPDRNNSQQARAASERVRSELDWSSISRRAIDFAEECAAERGVPGKHAWAR